MLPVSLSVRSLLYIDLIMARPQTSKEFVLACYIEVVMVLDGVYVSTSKNTSNWNYYSLGVYDKIA